MKTCRSGRMWKHGPRLDEGAAKPDLADRVRSSALSTSTSTPRVRLRDEIGPAWAAGRIGPRRPCSSRPSRTCCSTLSCRGARDVVETGLAHGCHVLSEKPMATLLEEARELIRLAAEAGRMHAVVQNRRYIPGIRRMRRADRKRRARRAYRPACRLLRRRTFRRLPRSDAACAAARHGDPYVRCCPLHDRHRTPLAVYCHETNPTGSWYRARRGRQCDLRVRRRRRCLHLSRVVVRRRCQYELGEPLADRRHARHAPVGRRTSASRPAVPANEGFHRSASAFQLQFRTPADPAQTNGHASVIAAFIDAVETGAPPETISSDNINSLAMVFAAVKSAETGSASPFQIKELRRYEQPRQDHPHRHDDCCDRRRCTRTYQTDHALGLRELRTLLLANDKRP